jgi:hypothetical protein
MNPNTQHIPLAQCAPSISIAGRALKLGQHLLPAHDHDTQTRFIPEGIAHSTSASSHDPKDRGRQLTCYSACWWDSCMNAHEPFATWALLLGAWQLADARPAAFLALATAPPARAHLLRLVFVHHALLHWASDR